MLRLLAALTLFAFAGYGQVLDLKRFQGASLREFMEDSEVRTLPLTVQVIAASGLFRNVAAMPGREKYALMERVETLRSEPLGIKPLTFEVWSESHPLARRLYVEGREYKIFRYGSFLLGVALVPDDRELVFHVSGDLDPSSKISVNMVGDQAELVALVPSIARIRRLSGQDMGKRVTKGRFWRGLATSLRAGMATDVETTTTQGSFSGRAWDQRMNGLSFSGDYREQSTTTRSNTQLQQAIRDRAQAREDARNAKGDWYVEHEFLSTTLFPGRSASGLLYFERTKGAQSAILRILVGTVSLEFLFDLPSK